MDHGHFPLTCTQPVDLSDIRHSSTRHSSLYKVHMETSYRLESGCKRKAGLVSLGGLPDRFGEATRLTLRLNESEIAMQGVRGRVRMVRGYLSALLLDAGDCTM